VHPEVLPCWRLVQTYGFSGANSVIKDIDVQELVMVFQEAFREGREWCELGWDGINFVNHDERLYCKVNGIERSAPQWEFLNEFKRLLERYDKALVVSGSKD
jgi:hypothetical protein